MISQQGIETQGYQRDQQGEWAEKNELSGRHTGFKCGGRALGGGEGRD